MSPVLVIFDICFLLFWSFDWCFFTKSFEPRLAPSLRSVGVIKNPSVEGVYFEAVSGGHAIPETNERRVATTGLAKASHPLLSAADNLASL